MTNLETLKELNYEISETIDGFDKAIVGIATDGRLIYDMDLMVKCLMIREGMTDIQAREYIDYNMQFISCGEESPVIMELYLGEE